MCRLRAGAIAFLVFLTAAADASAQSFEAGVHVAAAKWSEFDGVDKGIGGRFTWLPIAIGPDVISPEIGIEADFTWYPAGFQPDGVSFSRRRVEGLFGATLGLQVNRIKPFLKAAAGFLNVSPTDGGFACIAIFPPPLACVLAGGATLPAYEIGGGIAIDATSRTFIRADIAQRLLQYPGPAFRGFGVREIEEEDFYGGALRFTIGGGIRF